jgi:hypothetical protein
MLIKPVSETKIPITTGEQMRLIISLTVLIMMLLVLPGFANAATKTIEQEAMWNDINKLFQSDFVYEAKFMLLGYIDKYGEDTESQALMSSITERISSEFSTFIVQKCTEFSRAGGECQLEIDSTLFYMDRGDSTIAWSFYKSANQKYSRYAKECQMRLANLFESAQYNFKHKAYQNCIDSLEIFLGTEPTAIGFNTVVAPKEPSARILLNKAHEDLRAVLRIQNLDFGGYKSRIGLSVSSIFLAISNKSSLGFGERLGGSLSYSRKLSTSSRLGLFVEGKYYKSRFELGEAINRPQCELTNVGILAGFSCDLARVWNGITYLRAGGGPVFINAKGHPLIFDRYEIEAPSFNATWPGYLIGFGAHSIGITKSLKRLSLGGEVFYFNCQGDKLDAGWNTSNLGIILSLAWHF